MSAEATGEAGESAADGEKKEAGADDGKEDGEEEKKEESKSEKVVAKKEVDRERIFAITTMLDDFENILSKNFSLFANYEDFSFAKSRTSEVLSEEFYRFFDIHFQGDFRVKN